MASFASLEFPTSGADHQGRLQKTLIRQITPGDLRKTVRDRLRVIILDVAKVSVSGKERMAWIDKISNTIQEVADAKADEMFPYIADKYIGTIRYAAGADVYLTALPQPPNFHQLQFVNAEGGNPVTQSPFFGRGTAGAAWTPLALATVKRKKSAMMFSDTGALQSKLRSFQATKKFGSTRVTFKPTPGVSLQKGTILEGKFKIRIFPRLTATTELAGFV